MSRSCLETHPWISFQLDLRKAHYSMWMDIGAIQSKIEHVANVMLPPPIAEDLLTLYLSKGVHGTTAIEGNTLSEDQVRKCIEGKTKLPPSQEYQAQEVNNIALASGEIANSILNGRDADLSVEQICNFNKMVLNQLPVEEGVTPGSIRTHSVVVRGVGYRGVKPENCEPLLAQMCEWINKEIQPTTPNHSIAFAVLRAILAHLYIAWIHPFGDGNGRTARLVEFQILLSAGVPSISAHLLSNHYNLTRSEYYRHLEIASKSGGDVLPFIRYAIEGFRDGLNLQIEKICYSQWSLSWRDHVYNQFRDKKGEAALRRRKLVLELHGKGPVSIAELEELTPSLARLYANKTRKTLSRDVNHLISMGLLCKTRKGINTNHLILLKLLPPRRFHNSEDE